MQIRSLRHRSTAPEKMDDLSVPDGEVRKALREIETVNRWLGGYTVVLNALNGLQPPDERTLTIMDIGSGGGDVLRAVWRWAVRKGRKVRLIGVDMNPAMTRYASKKSRHHEPILFRTADVFDPAIDADAPDVTMCSLFAHHFDQNDLVRLLQRMHSLSTRAVIINDLHRNAIAYYSISALATVFSRSSLFRYDAPLSVARSLNKREWKEALAAAGIDKYSIRWRWAWRWEIIITK